MPNTLRPEQHRNRNKRTTMTAITTDTPKDKNPLPSRANGHEVTTSKPPVPPLPIDVTSLSAAALVALVADATAELEKREAAFLESAREQATALGINPARLAAAVGGRPAKRVRTSGGPDGRSTVKAKFWCPTDHAQRWSGRGDPPPQWFRDLLASGVTREAMLIPEDAE
jgi:DNA-binding protein H-NS